MSSAAVRRSTQPLSVELTVDHEEMDAGAWSLSILSCSASAPGDISSVPYLAFDINAVQTSIVVANGGLPALPFNVSLASTGETMTVSAVVPTVVSGITLGTMTWTVARGQGGTIAAPAAAEATLSFQELPGANVTPRGAWGTIVENTTGWTNCSYQVWLTTDKDSRPACGTINGHSDLRTRSLSTFCMYGH